MPNPSAMMVKAVLHAAGQGSMIPTDTAAVTVFRHQGHDACCARPHKAWLLVLQGTGVQQPACESASRPRCLVVPVCRKLTAPGAVGDKGQQVLLFRSHGANRCCCCSGQGASKQPARLYEARRACPHGADCCRCCRGKGQQLPLLRHHGHNACHAAGAARDRHAQECLQLTAAGAAGDKGAAASLRERIERAAGEDDALLILAESLVKVARQAASGAPGAAPMLATGSGFRTYSGACKLVPLHLPHCTIATLRGIPPKMVSKQPSLVPSHLG